MHKKNLFRIIGLLLIFVLIVSCSACSGIQNAGDNTVKQGISQLLRSDHYRMIREEQYLIDDGGKMVWVSGQIFTTIFHNPYKTLQETKAEADGMTLNIKQYEKEKQSDIYVKAIYQYEDGYVAVDEFQSTRWDQEFFVTELLHALVSESFVEETMVDGRAMNKYTVIVGAYPFVETFVISHDKNEKSTVYFLEEMGECEGIAYVDIETGCIYRVEFDFSEKTDAIERVNERMRTEDEGWWVELPIFAGQKLRVDFVDVNVRNEEFARISQEIDEMTK